MIEMDTWMTQFGVRTRELCLREKCVARRCTPRPAGPNMAGRPCTSIKSLQPLQEGLREVPMDPQAWNSQVWMKLGPKGLRHGLGGPHAATTPNFQNGTASLNNMQPLMSESVQRRAERSQGQAGRPILGRPTSNCQACNERH
jgi:hypothetical protein